MILHGICARIFSILVLLLGKTFSTQIAFCYFIFQIIGEKSPDLAPSALLFFCNRFSTLSHEFLCKGSIINVVTTEVRYCQTCRNHTNACELIPRNNCYSAECGTGFFRGTAAYYGWRNMWSGFRGTTEFIPRKSSHTFRTRWPFVPSRLPRVYPYP